MKKIIVLFIVLIILAGLAFFGGWAQFRVSPGLYGVMRSKTHGVDSRLIREGEFYWVWYKLIPTNVVIQIFSLDSISRSFKAQGVLPSGDTYVSLAGLEGDFSYDISAVFSFNINPDFLTTLIAERNIRDQEDLDAFEETLADTIEAFITRRLRIYAEEEKNAGEILRSGSMDVLGREVAAAFPNIEHFSCLLQMAHFPDFALYRAVRSLYEEYLARQREYLRVDMTRSAEIRLGSQIRFDELTKYGELLTKYPILLQYLSIENNQPENTAAELALPRE
ncbi:MAG: hypothetical protein LBP43_06685 [Treponema sp.]|nr:hypothetical protein [Treponema sp.]